MRMTGPLFQIEKGNSQGGNQFFFFGGGVTDQALSMMVRTFKNNNSFSCQISLVR
jgi:hypothetical protein